MSRPKVGCLPVATTTRASSLRTPTIKAIDSRMFVPAQQSARSMQSNRHLRMADSVRPETHGQTSEQSKSLKWIVCNNSIVILPVIQIFGQYLIASGFACGGYHHCVIKLDIVPSLDFQGILHGNGIGSDHLQVIKIIKNTEMTFLSNFNFLMQTLVNSVKV